MTEGHDPTGLPGGEHNNPTPPPPPPAQAPLPPPPSAGSNAGAAASAAAGDAAAHLKETFSTWSWTPPSIAVVAGAAVTIIGSFMPWATWGPFSVGGFEGDGKLTFILGLAAGGLGAYGIAKNQKNFVYGAIAAAVISVLISFYDMTEVWRNGSADNDFIDVGVSVGSGLYLTFLGSVAALVGCILWVKGTKSESSPTPPAPPVS